MMYQEHKSKAVERFGLGDFTVRVNNQPCVFVSRRLFDLVERSGVGFLIKSNAISEVGIDNCPTPNFWVCTM